MNSKKNDDPDEDNHDKPPETPPAPPPKGGQVPESNMKQMLKELELKSKQIETLEKENLAFKSQVAEFAGTVTALDSYKAHVGTQVKTMFEAIPETRRKFVAIDERNPLESMKALNTYQAMMSEIEAEIKKEAGITEGAKSPPVDPNKVNGKKDDKPPAPRSLTTAAETRARFLKIKQAGIEKPENK